MKLFNKDGVEMMEVKSIDLDSGDLVLKGKMMKSMATTIRVRPEDIWDAFRLFPLGVMVQMPWLLAKGFWRARRRDGQAQAAKPG